MQWVNWKAASGAAASGTSPGREGKESEFQIVPCRDGHVAVVYTVTQWPATRALIGDERLEDAKFATRAGRRKHIAELYDIITPWFADKTRAEIQTGGAGQGRAVRPDLLAGRAARDRAVRDALLPGRDEASRARQAADAAASRAMERPLLRAAARARDRAIGACGMKRASPLRRARARFRPADGRRQHLGHAGRSRRRRDQDRIGRLPRSLPRRRQARQRRRLVEPLAAVPLHQPQQARPGAQPQGSRRPARDPRAGDALRRRGREFPPRRARSRGPGLRRAEGDQSAHRVRRHLQPGRHRAGAHERVVRQRRSMPPPASPRSPATRARSRASRAWT